MGSELKAGREVLCSELEDAETEEVLSCEF